MYMVELTEDKLDALMSHVGKGLKSLNKVVECLAEMKEHHGGNYDYEDEDEDDDEAFDERYGNRSANRPIHRYGGRRMNAGGGRYSRY